MTDEGEEEYWSRFAATYDRDGEYVVGEAILQAMKGELLKEGTLGDAVEFGCGTGYFTAALARNARRVVATDLSEQMLHVARERLSGAGNVSLRKADCARTSFAEQSFDTVLMVNLLHVMHDPAGCLRESRRILREKGVLIALDLTGYGMGLAAKIALAVRYVRKWGMPPRHGRNSMSPEELELLVGGAGYAVVSARLLGEKVRAVYLKAEKS